jgi:hypothetical protein
MLRRLACLGAVILALSPARTAGAAQQDIASRGPNGGQRIVGRVTDTLGRAVGGVYVSLLRDQEGLRGAPRLRPVSVRLYSITNQNGEFVLENLSPDSYCLVALPHDAPVRGQNRLNRAGYAITYYPNATSPADAKSVMVTPTAGAIANITLAPARLSVVSGVVIGSNGRPAPGAMLRVAHGDGLFGLGGIGATIRPDGTFALAGLPPGTYFLHMREGVWPPPRDVIPKVSVAKVTVVDRDVTGVRVEPMPMVRATGRIIVDPAIRASFQRSTIQVVASPFDWQGNPGPNRPGTLRDDLTFEFRTWPALGYVRVLPESQWIVARVRLNGVDVTNTGIDFRAGQEISGLEVDLIKGPSR